MIIVRHINYQFLQIGVFSDRAQSIPVSAQFRMSSVDYKPFSEFVKKAIIFANGVREDYHDSKEAQFLYHKGHVDSFFSKSLDKAPIVLIFIPGFLEFRLVIGGYVLDMNSEELEELSQKLLEIE